ncbi:hypothetical protein QN326_05310 [Candidatus Phytoplasma asteris]|uniref:Uncharacterized protein n=1 Tax=Candidatus Phytoplasma asteris TaxID=85620 RepID=A0ABZ3CD16_9MOLU
MFVIITNSVFYSILSQLTPHYNTTPQKIFSLTIKGANK